MGSDVTENLFSSFIVLRFFKRLLAQGSMLILLFLSKPTSVERLPMPCLSQDYEPHLSQKPDVPLLKVYNLSKSVDCRAHSFKTEYYRNRYTTLVDLSATAYKELLHYILSIDNSAYFRLSVQRLYAYHYVSTPATTSRPKIIYSIQDTNSHPKRLVYSTDLQISLGTRQVRPSPLGVDKDADQRGQQL